MNINFEYYKIFYIIAKNKNITKAANELNISQPAISRILKTMEEQMNTKLFIRKSKGVFLTPEGNELYRLIGNEINNIIKAENNFIKVINNTNIKVAINTTLLKYFINSNKLDNLLNYGNDVSFINTNNFDLLNNQLANNLIDFAIITEPDNFQFSGEIKFKKIDELHLTFVSPSNDNSYNKPIVLQESNSKFGKLTMNYLQNSNINYNKIIMVDDYDNILSFINKGYASGFVIKETIINELENKFVYEIDLPTNLPTINIGILYNKNNELKIQNLFKNLKHGTE